MSRLSLLLVVVAGLATGAAGCAHCDTCDDFPVPCSGGNCGPSAFAPEPMPGVLVSPGMAAPPIGTAMPVTSAPVISSQPGPFSAPLPAPLGTDSQPARGETPPATPNR